MPVEFIKDEELWEKAKKIVKDQYNLSEKDGEKFWKLVMGVYKQGGGKLKKKKMQKSEYLYLDLEKSENRYTILRWNGEDGEDALFVIKDNLTGKQTLFSPYAPELVDWVDYDLLRQEPMNTWQDFGNESVSSLDDIVF